MPNEKSNQNNDTNVAISQVNNDTILITSQDKYNQKNIELFEKAMYDLESKQHTYSAYLNDAAMGNSDLTNEDLDILASNPQTDLLKIQRINSYVRKEINGNSLIAKVFRSIESNLNTKSELVFKNYANNRNKNKTREKAQQIINDFNEKINLEDLITKIVPMTYIEGNYFLYLRTDNEDYKVDYYPLGVVELSDYENSGEPYLLINIRELTARLRKINKKNKDGTYLFFKDVGDEIKNNYPSEVYDAYINKDTHAKLNIENSGVIRINNLNRKYGLSCVFPALKPSLMLDSFKLADQSNAKARGKTIIFQKTDNVLLGQDGSKKPYNEVQYSHLELAKALSKEGVCLYTGMPWSSSIEYIEPKNPVTNNDTINSYKSEIAMALGISYLISDKSTIADINIKELMKMIDKITNQLQKILKKWYKLILSKNGIPSEFAPDIKIVDSELMSVETRITLGTFLFNTLGTSYKTLYSMLDIDFEQERQRRELEESDGTTEIFKPRLTAYTSNADALNKDNKGGNPKESSDPDKEQYDKDYNKDNLR